jgi:hypothetical protein
VSEFCEVIIELFPPFYQLSWLTSEAAGDEALFFLFLPFFLIWWIVDYFLMRSSLGAGDTLTDGGGC